MGNCGRPIPIRVVWFHNSGSEISRVWANREGRDRGNGLAKTGGRAKAVSGVRTTEGAPKAADRLNDKASGSGDRKAEGNGARAAVKAEVGREILSFWPSIQTVMASCRPVKSPMRPRRLRHWTRTVTGTSRAMRCGPLMLIAIEGLAVTKAAARLKAVAVHPRVSHVRRKAIRVLH
jgi:hypothetical protein